MAKLLTVFILQLLSAGNFRLCLLQRTDLRSVSPGENITLHCDITAKYEIWWYHQSSEEMKLLVSAVKGKLNRSFSLNYIINNNHYNITINTSSVDLVITGVTESDLGLYYCGGRNTTTHIQFGKAIKLIFRDEGVESSSSSVQSDTERSPDPTVYWIIILILTPVCLIQTIIIFLCGVCYRVTGKRCSDPHSTEKDVLQCGSLQYSTATTGASEGSTASASDIMTQTYPHCTSGTFTAVIFEVVNQK